MSDANLPPVAESDFRSAPGEGPPEQEIINASNETPIILQNLFLHLFADPELSGLQKPRHWIGTLDTIHLSF